ncbi:hypothetical protein [Clostridium perfringens]|uniref:hypothetical protein n=1 Tax=Clostridium perfringens TaxID=1502 RepID=UPI00233FBF0C|nr:hypothetical protein [Clostridium perfringens]MDC4245668.1 hypothetical protein [Clostridium perfringens]
MKAIFNYNGKELVNEKIEDVSLAIEFFDEELDDIFEEYDCMEDYVFDLLEEKTNIYNMFRIGLEAPIDEIVYFHFDYFTGEGEEGCYPKTKEELQILIKMYNEVLKAFNKDQVKIEVTSNTLWKNCNQEGFSLEEFLKMFRLEEEQ